MEQTVNGSENEVFYTCKVVKQGCLLNSSLFTALTEDTEEIFRKTQTGRKSELKK